MFAAGDMHASMGDGEISGTGVEIAGEVDIRLGLVKGAQGRWPVTEIDGHWVAHATSCGDIREALELASRGGGAPARRPVGVRARGGLHLPLGGLRRRHRAGLPAVAVLGDRAGHDPEDRRLPAAVPQLGPGRVPTVRIAVASTPLTATLAEAVPAAIAAVEEAARLGAAIVCLPETGGAGPPHAAATRARRDQEELDRAIDEIAAAARRAGVVAIVGTERPTAGGPRDRLGRARRRRRAARRAGEDADRPLGGGALRRGQRPAHVHGRRCDVRRSRSATRRSAIPRSPRARARRRPGRLRTALGHDRRRLAADALDRRRRTPTTRRR